MIYRRFGRTELQMPVFSLGGMRYPQGWERDLTLETIQPQSLETVREIIARALEVGICHIETARGYGVSELMLGEVLRDIPRDRYLLQTKVAPDEDPAKFEATLETSMRLLRAEYLDLFGFHGINSEAELHRTIRPGGCLEVVRRWQRDGRIRHAGFSTHGVCALIVKAIETGEFDYVNLHWYFINQTNAAAIDAARAQDMGLFIISPTDKGGKLFAPTQKLRDHCAPLHPITFNDLFCLRRPDVHTLSVGAGQPSDFDEHLAALPYLQTPSALASALEPVEARIHETMTRELGADWWPHYNDSVPVWSEVPGQVNLQYIFRLWSWAKAFDMHDYGKYRYGMIEGGKGGTWMAGEPADNVDEQAIRECLNDHPARDRVPGILREAHQWFSGHARKPQSSH